MNVDTLKVNNSEGKWSGAYRQATIRDIASAVDICGVTHLESYNEELECRVVVAMRRCSKPNTYMLDTVIDEMVKGRNRLRWRAPMRNLPTQYGLSRSEIISKVYRLLNGKECVPFVPFNDLYVWVNQANREAEVLAVIGNEMLVEYSMPAGTTAMLICSIFEEKDARLLPKKGRMGTNCSYIKIPKKWLKAMWAAGTSWEGRSQRASTQSPIPFPSNPDDNL